MFKYYSQNLVCLLIERNRFNMRTRSTEAHRNYNAQHGSMDSIVALVMGPSYVYSIG